MGPDIIPADGKIAVLWAQGLPSIAEKTRGMERKDGLVPLYWDALAGKLWMEVPRAGEEMI